MAKHIIRIFSSDTKNCRCIELFDDVTNEIVIVEALDKRLEAKEA